MKLSENLLCVLLAFCFHPFLCYGSIESAKKKETFLEPGRVLTYTPEEWSIYKPGLMIYCYAGQPPTLVNAFCTVSIRLNCDHENFNQYAGSDPAEVEAHWNEDQSLFSFNVFASKKRRQVELEPFNQSCLGIVSSGKYEIEVLLNRFDLWRFGLLALGVLLFSSARSMSQNALFYYSGGILVGLGTFALAMVYFFSKLMPYRPLMLGFMVGGWTLGFYGMQLLYENLRLIFIQYQHYVFWYMTVVGSISFLICYRLGPPKDPRSKQVIQWGLQLVALTLIFFCSYQRTLSTALVLLVIIGHYISVPLSALRWLRNRFRKRFPARRRLLTVEEFEEQGRVETDRALKDLREYCRSPECKQWSTMMKLHEPRRFASFVEGSPHVLEEECFEYDNHYSSQSLHDSDELVDFSEDEEDENA
ncbi:nuclear envelope integral membrane protein [Anopheles ziemanni]|uniref:nuclear envelope integral membrane protein n=1 Tax=Anopheles coustani TaxID=139045 RepID=UPI0026598F27|nr:nuclear envelope integral membrane protein [Anopheles coustani]XP_058177372.1 nuclear envelope integral membrane protein [Anopheles ziemanni]